MPQSSSDRRSVAIDEDAGGVAETLDGLSRAAKGEKTITLQRVVEAFDARSYGPFLLVPALLEISPIGGIPGVPTVIALTIALFAVQILLGRRTMWLPGFIARRQISSGKINDAVDKLQPVARFMDRWFRGRMAWLTKGPLLKAAALACVLLAATVPPLELIPFASTAPMAAIAAFGLALLVRDGALMIVASLFTTLTVGIGIHLLLR